MFCYVHIPRQLSLDLSFLELLHQIIAGGDGFASKMDYGTTQASTCTSCPVKQDKSNYWAPMLYYERKDGKFIASKIANIQICKSSAERSASIRTSCHTPTCTSESTV